MSTCTTCDDNILNPKITEKPFCINCPEQESKCGLGKFPADCVIYHIDDETPSKLSNIGAPNRSSVSSILEAIDKLVGQNFNTPLKANDSKTIRFTTSGVAHHTLIGNVKISTALGNLIQENDDGLFLGTTDLGKVRVSETGVLGYLGEKTIGDTDGIISISTVAENDLLKISPSISVENLLTDIRTNHLSSFNQLLSVSNTSNNNSGGTTVVSMQSKLAPFIAYPYHGSMVNFDETGKGLASNGYDKIYVCNGANGTPDYRGRSPIGANAGVPGGDLDASVNPNNDGNISISVNQTAGAYSHKLANQELAPHAHTVRDDGHYHKLVVNGEAKAYLPQQPEWGIAWTTNHNNGNQDYDLNGNPGTPTIGKSENVVSNISINTSDTANLPHNNTHPVIGTIFIMYIP